MDNKDSRINQILSYLAKAASTAADGVNEAVQSAGSAVGDKYSTFKLNMELSRLKTEQEQLFENIGRTLFMVKSGAFDDKDDNGEPVDGQDTVDKLLALAQEKQIDIDDLAKKVSDLNGNPVCAACGKTANPNDVFCARCGAKLPEYDPISDEADVKTEE